MTSRAIQYAQDQTAWAAVRVAAPAARDEATAEQGSPAGLARIHKLLRGRYPWALAAALALAAAGAVLGYRLKAPVYRSTALIRIAPVLPKIIYSTEQNGTLPAFDAFVDSQAALVRSQRVVELAVENRDWKALGRRSGEDTLKEFTTSLGVNRQARSELITVTFDDADPAAAAVAVKAVLDAYMRFYGEADAKSDQQREAVIKDRVAALEADLARLRGRIQEEATEFGSDDLEEMYKFKVSELNKLESTLKETQLALALAESAGGKGPGAEAALSPARIAATDPQMRQYLGDRYLAEMKLETLLQNAGERNPQVQTLRTQLKLLDRNIEELAARHADDPTAGGTTAAPSAAAGLHRPAGPAGALPHDPAQLRERVRLVEGLYKQAKSEVVQLGVKQLRIVALRTELQSTQERLRETKARLEQLSIESQASGRVSVVSPGDRPHTPYQDRRNRNAVALGLGGACSGLGLVLLLGLMDRRIRTLGDAPAGNSAVPLLGVLPDLAESASDAEERSLASLGVHQTRARLQLLGIDRPAGRKGVVFAVTSPVSGSGKTSLTVALGSSFASTNSRTLLIDCDIIGRGLSSRIDGAIRRRIGRTLLRQGSITEAELRRADEAAAASGKWVGQALVEMGFAREDDVRRAVEERQAAVPGLMGVFAGQELRRCTVPSSVAGLEVLPVGAAVPADAERLSPAGIRLLLDAARAEYDTIVIDTGPTPGSLEASIVCPAADAVVVAVARGEERRLAEQCLSHLQTIGARVCGFVFNKAHGRDIDAFGTTRRSQGEGRSRSRGSRRRAAGAAGTDGAPLARSGERAGAEHVSFVSAGAARPAGRDE